MKIYIDGNKVRLRETNEEVKLHGIGAAGALDTPWSGQLNLGVGEGLFAGGGPPLDWDNHRANLDWLQSKNVNFIRGLYVADWFNKTNVHYDFLGACNSPVDVNYRQYIHDLLTEMEQRGIYLNVCWWMIYNVMDQDWRDDPRNPRYPIADLCKWAASHSISLPFDHTPGWHEVPNKLWDEIDAQIMPTMQVFSDFQAAVAQEFGNHPNALFEFWNEATGGTDNGVPDPKLGGLTPEQAWQQAMQLCINKMRAHTDAILIPSFGWSGNGMKWVDIYPLTDPQNNLFPTMHWYRDAFTWKTGVTEFWTWDGVQQAMRSAERLVEQTLAAGTPVYVGEFGANMWHRSGVQRFLGDGSTTVFTLSFGKTPNVDIIWVNNVPKHKGVDWSYSEPNEIGTFTFTTPPPSGADIYVLRNPDFTQLAHELLMYHNGHRLCQEWGMAFTDWTFTEIFHLRHGILENGPWIPPLAPNGNIWHEACRNTSRVIMGVVLDKDTLKPQNAHVETSLGSVDITDATLAFVVPAPASTGVPLKITSPGYPEFNVAVDTSYESAWIEARIGEVSPPPQACTIDTDCPPGHICINGTCIQQIFPPYEPPYEPWTIFGFWQWPVLNRLRAQLEELKRRRQQ